MGDCGFVSVRLYGEANGQYRLFDYFFFLNNFEMW